MRQLFVSCYSWLACAAVFAGSCHLGADDEAASPDSIARLAPTAVSDPDGWRLFDRSIAAGYLPDSTPLSVTFAQSEVIAALKVYGPAPYRLEVDGAGVFEAVDLSKLTPGWHRFEPASIQATKSLELRFVPLGPPGPVPELEFWGPFEEAAAKADITASDLPAGFVRLLSASASSEIAPGECASFAVTIEESPAQLRRAYLAYEAKGAVRPFVIRRSVNSQNEHGGNWLSGADGATRTLVDELDPATLRLGDNEVRLCSPDDAKELVTIRKVRIVGERDLGVRLAESVELGDARRDGSALLDGDPTTTASVGSKEPISIEFPRLIAPDAIVLSTQSEAEAQVTCISASGPPEPLPVQRVAGGLSIDGGASACASLQVVFDGSMTLGEIDVIGSGAAEPVDWPRLIITSPAEHFGNRAWVGGFVARPPRMTGAARVSIAARELDRQSDEFGELIERAPPVVSKWTVEVDARFPDGTQAHRRLVLDRDVSSEVGEARPDIVASSTKVGTALSEEGAEVVVRAPRAKASQLRLGARAGLDIPPGAVSTPTDITARHLGDAVLPPPHPPRSGSRSDRRPASATAACGSSSARSRSSDRAMTCPCRRGADRSAGPPGR